MNADGKGILQAKGEGREGGEARHELHELTRKGKAEAEILTAKNAKYTKRVERVLAASNPPMTHHALQALGGIGATDCLPPLFAAMTNSDRFIRADSNQ